jgi:hypothetical protein
MKTALLLYHFLGFSNEESALFLLLQAEIGAVNDPLGFRQKRAVRFGYVENNPYFYNHNLNFRK